MGRLRNYNAAIIFLEFKLCGISITEKRGFKNNFMMVMTEIIIRNLLYFRNLLYLLSTMLSTLYVLPHLIFKQSCELDFSPLILSKGKLGSKITLVNWQI